MRFMLCKFHCSSFICFCKSSPRLYTPEPLKLENAPHVHSTVVSVSDESSCQLPAEVKDGMLDKNLKQPQINGGVCLKSSLKKKKKVPQEVKESRENKKKVQWMDFSGKELVEIREFDSRWVIPPYADLSIFFLVYI